MPLKLEAFLVLWKSFMAILIDLFCQGQVLTLKVPCFLRDLTGTLQCYICYSGRHEVEPFSAFLVPFSRTCGPWGVCCMRCARYSWPSPRTTLSTSSSPSAAAATGNHFCLIRSVADPGCLSRIRIFSIPVLGSGVKKIPDPGSASKNLSILTQNIVSKLSEILNRDVHPGSGSWIFTHPGSQIQEAIKAPDSGSRIWIRTTAYS